MNQGHSADQRTPDGVEDKSVAHDLHTASSTPTESSPFWSMARQKSAPNPQRPRGNGTGHKGNLRGKVGKPDEGGLRAAQSGGVRLKPSHSSRQQEKPTNLPRASRAPPETSAGGKGALKALAHAPKVTLKPERGRERGKGSIKRTLSMEELQAQPKRMERSSSGGLGSHKPAPKKLLHRLTFGPSAATEKVGIALPVLAPMEKKILAALGEREWLRIDKEGATSILMRDKHAVTHELGIQIRDLRLLDPRMTSSYPSCILSREKALVVNLEYIRCIITTSSVLLLDANKAPVQAFIAHLQSRLREARDMCSEPRLADPADHRSSQLPFELTALEVALDEVCRHLECLCADLEVSVRPMTGVTAAGKVTSDFLERLRRVKTTLVSLKTRVETLKEVLEKYLDDGDDLKSIHLSGKIREQRAAAFRRLARRSLRSAAGPQQPPSPHEPCASVDGRLLLTQDLDDIEAEREATEVEMLLEGYYMNLDSTWNKLADVSEMLDDAEELMDIEMDTYRNNIIRMKVFLGLCHFSAGSAWAVANIMGMNLGLGPDSLIIGHYRTFVEVTTILFGGILLLVGGFTWYLHQRRLAITTITA